MKKEKLKETLTMDDFYVVSYVSWAELERVMGKRRYKKFMKWMSGQTCYPDGVYPWDLRRFLLNLPVID
jgi:hypothetical protein